MRPVALLTDFGLADPYAGQMRAALARLAPGATVLDISHQVEPYAVSQAAFFLAASAPHLPDDAVFVCVVDPEVGSARRILGLRQAGQEFLAPDNGLLSLLLGAPNRHGPQVFDMTREALTYAASATFHGRDVFAPLAARLSAGEKLEDMGARLDPDELVRQPWAEPCVRPDGVTVHVLHVDRYGNCLLSLPAEFVAPRPVGTLRLPLGQRRGVQQVHVYAELPPGAVGLLAGSQGYFELAANQASAAKALGLRRGDVLGLLWGPPC